MTQKVPKALRAPLSATSPKKCTSLPSIGPSIASSRDINVRQPCQLIANFGKVCNAR
ncbi:hypothetical protein M404DRAFT_1004805, partial [Pisolithus tinctorius Marx 270]